MIRQFDQSLLDVKNLLLRMGEQVEIAIDKAVKSLAKMDDRLAREVLEHDPVIDEMESKLDDAVAKLIATRQPVATDLRRLIAAMKIASDMERMADLAANIAQVTVQLVEGGLSLFKNLEDIPKMAAITQQMVHDGINSYIDENVALARKLADTDDEVDRMYHAIVNELIGLIKENQAETEVALRLCFVARYLERIADHATNIAESIVYIQTGKRADLN